MQDKELTLNSMDVGLLLDCVQAVSIAMGDTPGLRKLSKVIDSADNYEIVHPLAKGGHSEVFVVRCNETKKIFALKKVQKIHILNDPLVNPIMKERESMICGRNSEWLLGLHKSFQDEGSLYFLTDFISGGDLGSLCCRIGVLSEKSVQFYAGEILMALKELHALGMIHRDIKPENILIDSEGHIKLADFGSTTTLDGDDHLVVVGTPDYVAPELLLPEKTTEITTKLDLWALGVVVYELLFGDPPFYEESVRDTYKRIMSMEYEIQECSKEVESFIKGLLCREDTRLSIEEAMSHPFLKGFDFTSKYANAPEYIPKATPLGSVDNFAVDDFVPDKTLPPKSLETFKKFIGFGFDPQIKLSTSGTTEKEQDKKERTIDSFTETLKCRSAEYVVAKEVSEANTKTSTEKDTEILMVTSTQTEEQELSISITSTQTTESTTLLKNNLSPSEDNNTNEYLEEDTEEGTNIKEESKAAIKHTIKEPSIHSLNQSDNIQCLEEIKQEEKILKEVSTIHITKTATQISECLDSEPSPEPKEQEKEREENNQFLEEEKDKSITIDITTPYICSNCQSIQSLTDTQFNNDHTKPIISSSAKETSNNPEKTPVKEEAKEETKKSEPETKKATEEKEKKEEYARLYSISCECLDQVENQLETHLAQISTLALSTLEAKLALIQEQTYKIVQKTIKNKEIEEEKTFQARKIIRSLQTELREAKTRIDRETEIRAKLAVQKESLIKENAQIKEQMRRLELSSVARSFQVKIYADRSWMHTTLTLEGDHIRIKEIVLPLNKIYFQNLKKNEVSRMNSAGEALSFKLLLPSEEDAYTARTDSSSDIQSTAGEDQVLKDQLAKETKLLEALDKMLSSSLSATMKSHALSQKKGAEKKIEELKQALSQGVAIPAEAGTIRYNNHSFKPTTFNASAQMWCSECNRPLYGKVQQGLLCRGCRMVCHRECHTLVQYSCEMYQAMERGTSIILMAKYKEDKDTIQLIVNGQRIN
ncbi:serine/threonine-protein kinase MRCK [Nematocida sp. AWRm80]|nr:serine/threonine-protein kinase MRCK [Nematocida sp. AWRm80]